MDTGPSILLPILGALFGSWLCLSAFVLGSRAIHDLQRDEAEAAAGVAPRRGRRHLHLPWRWLSAAHLLTADAAAPATPEVVQAARAEAREHGSRLLRAASAHRGERGRWRRIAALRILARAEDPQALPLLERAIAGGDAELAGAAVDIVGSIGTRSATELLLRVLREGTYSRSRVASHLDRSAVPIGDLLLPMLEDASPSVRFWAATLLSHYGGRREVGTALAAHAADADPNVRAAIAESLGACRRSRGRDTAVHELLADPVWYVRVHAARSVGNLALASATATLVSLLADEEWWVRAAAKDGLTALGAAAQPALVAGLDHPDRFARNGAAEVLQNTGYVDTLVASVLDPSHRPRQSEIDLMRHIVAAGGRELRESALARLETADMRERLEQLLGDGPVFAEAA